MNAQLLYDTGQLDGAIEALGVELRNDPTDARRRTFLFELLCFAGAYDRAERQLDVLARSSHEAELGAWLYRSALQGERVRQQMFQGDSLPSARPSGKAVAGTINGRAFSELLDADPRIGARVEAFVAGQYTWIPLEHIAAIHMTEPKRLRDLLWIPARIQAGPGFRGAELGEVLLPALTPLAWQHPEGDIRLGRVTDWQELGDGTQVPIGQKLLLVDGEPFPILALRKLEISPVSPP